MITIRSFIIAPPFDKEDASDDLERWHLVLFCQSVSVVLRTEGLTGIFLSPPEAVAWR